ncbi:MAG: TIGR04282 family arsenosugar biosynthesis glycosyltransferase [Leptospirales bacterium]|nr:TIGR04282 family arsenosugar biosynthesis glycosyltransferase [Leptospirales bacterium]
MSNVLAIFMKTPRAGLVKTRLARSVGDQEAVAVYRQLVEHLFRQVCSRDASYEVQVFLGEKDGVNEVRAWLNLEAPIRTQKGSDLGTRIANAFRELFALKYDKAVIVGVDAPGLSRALVEASFAALEKADAVIGPALDGGYYLLGLKKMDRTLFENIDWSTSRVLAQTTAQLERRRMSYFFLQELRDIDTLEDLQIEGFGDYSCAQRRGVHSKGSRRH